MNLSFDNLEVSVCKKGADRYTKVTYPIRYGRYIEVRTSEYLFEFNLNGEIKYIRGLNDRWPHPMEWLKRTDGNDWVYYSTGAYKEVFSFLGEYYRPCLPYSSNSLWDYDPFSESGVREAIKSWSELTGQLKGLINNGIPNHAKKFFTQIEAKNSFALKKRAQVLHNIIGSRISVLPPDTRHVDYDVIPVMIADGCLYQCGFCCLKTSRHFHPRSKAEIRRQIDELKQFYGANLKNYNAVFLGNHEALAAGSETICMAAEASYSAFRMDDSYIENPTLYLFGSVDSLLKADDQLFKALNGLPFYTYINIGLESAHAGTLEHLDKPVPLSKIKAAFEKMIAVNRSYHRLEVTANFIMGDRLAEKHYGSLEELVLGSLGRFYSKGALYLSPLTGTQSKVHLQRAFIALKNRSRLPTYIYMIQRL